MTPTYIDHITVTAATLEAGARAVEQALGVRALSGGTHPRMGTHNLLLRLGDTLFLEIIAIQPEAPAPDGRAGLTWTAAIRWPRPACRPGWCALSSWPSMRPQPVKTSALWSP